MRNILDGMVYEVASFYETAPSLAATARHFDVVTDVVIRLFRKHAIHMRSKAEANHRAFTEDRKRAYSERMSGKPSHSLGKRWSHPYRPKPWVHGDRNVHWKGGRTALCQKIRNSNLYCKWRSEVFVRDNFKCVECGIRGGRLNADHRTSFSSILDSNKIVSYEQAMTCAVLWDVSNGRTLCFPCHKKTPNYAGKSFRKAK